MANDEGSQSSQTLSPKAVAQIVGVNSQTIRRWCEDHAAHLSAGANPPKGVARELTEHDVEVLRTVKQLRREGLLTPAINDRLKGVVFAVPAPMPEGSQAAQEGPGQAQAAIVVAEALRSVEARLQALEQKTDERFRPLESQRMRFDIAFLLAIVFIAGLIVGLSAWWFR